MSRRTLTQVIWLSISLYISITLAKSLWQLMRASDRVTSQTVKLEEKKNQLAELESRLEYVNSYEFIEKEAREKLNLQRPGEIVLVVPETAPTILVEEDEKGEDLTNWQKWIKLFM